MLNTTLRNGPMLLIWLCLIFSVRAEEVPFLAPQQRPQLEANQPWPADRFLVLAYHDVEDDAADQRYLSVRTSALNEQIAWLLHNGYHAISVQDILDAHYGLKSLPPKAFLLSFDDGYSSFYTRVWPLLKAWNVPALWAPVGSWVDTPAGQPVNFGGLMTPRERFATWEMVRELSRSPLVEIGAHTWASHYGLPANPQGSREPAAANRGWDKTTGRYESDAQFTRRMTDDVQKVTAKIHEVAGKTPRAWVWPYGAASGSTLTIAKQQGYQLAFTLNDGLGNVKDLDNIPRLLIAGNPSLKAFASAVTQIQEADPVRVMHVDLDYVYDPNPVQQAKNIDKLVQRVYDMKISHVFLQAFSDPQGDGTVKSLYFPNRWLPMRADLFNFVSWQLQTRGNVKVYAWMPVLAFDLASDLPRVQRWDPQTGKALLARQPYVRLSPWDPRVRQQITDIYEDLARHASFSGILFHDDAVLTDFEDVSPEAVAAWRRQALADVGYWSPDMITEDIDISWKLQLRHWDIFFEPRALCWILMPETLKGLWKQRLRWAQGGAEVFLVNLRRLFHWQHHRMWPLFLEYACSTLWAFAYAITILLFILSRLMPLPDNLAVHSLFPPEFTGMLLGLMCLLQFVASLYIERRYEKKVAKSLFWVIWFPMVYWMIGLLTTLVAFPKVMVKRQRSRARWVSPDRGKGSL